MVRRDVEPDDGLHERGIHWVIIGGESGPKSRPFILDWARSVLAQCRAAGVPWFVKQLGAWPTSDGPTMWPSGRVTPYPNLREYLQDRKGGRPAEWPEDLRVREFPGVRG